MLRLLLNSPWNENLYFRPTSPPIPHPKFILSGTPGLVKAPLSFGVIAIFNFTKTQGAKCSVPEHVNPLSHGKKPNLTRLFSLTRSWSKEFRVRLGKIPRRFLAAFEIRFYTRPAPKVYSKPGPQWKMVLNVGPNFPKKVPPPILFTQKVLFVTFLTLHPHLRVRRLAT